LQTEGVSDAAEIVALLRCCPRGGGAEEGLLVKGEAPLVKVRG